MDRTPGAAGLFAAVRRVSPSHAEWLSPSTEPRRSWPFRNLAERETSIQLRYLPNVSRTSPRHLCPDIYVHYEVSSAGAAG